MNITEKQFCGKYKIFQKKAAIKLFQYTNGYIPKDMSQLLEITRGYL